MNKKRPGRPRKYNAVRRLSLILPYEVALEMERDKGNMSWTEFFIMLYSKYKYHIGEKT